MTEVAAVVAAVAVLAVEEAAALCHLGVLVKIHASSLTTSPPTHTRMRFIGSFRGFQLREIPWRQI